MEYNEKDLSVQLHTENLNKLQNHFPHIPAQLFSLSLALHFSSIMAHLSNGLRVLNPLISEAALTGNLSSDGQWVPDQSFTNRILETVVSITSPVHRNDMISLAHYLIDSALTEVYGLPRQHAKVTATLCKMLYDSSEGLPLIDLYPTTAELALRDRNRARLKTLFIGEPRGALEKTLIQLKLRLANIKPHFISKSTYKRQKFSGSTYLIDPPPSKAGNAELSEPAKSFNEFLTEIDLACRVFLISSTSLTNRKDIEKAIAHHKDKSIHVESVIEFNISKSKDSRRLAIILSCDQHPSSNKTLYLDVSSRNHALPDFEINDRAIIAGRILHLHQGTKANLFNQDDLKIQNFLNAQFLNGYKNIKNICFSARKNSNSPTRINIARSFISRNQIDATTVTQTADLSELIEILEATARPSCLFIIGNNGAGKSLLLRELITKLSNKKLTSVGISTTIHDRFPYSDKSAIASKFIYSGSRTSLHSIAILQKDKLAHQQTASILKHQEKLDIFVKCLTYLGYAPRFYLIKKTEVDENTAISERFTQLSLTAQENKLPENLEKYEFGFVRAGSETIRTSSSLSSGEQNINHLLMNIITHCEQGRVFLIDEPEVSLHLQWQQNLPHVLHILSKQYRVSFVVATHSPTLITNANDSNMYCYQLSEGKLQILNEEQRYSVESIILDGFNTYTPNNRGVHEKCAKLVAQTIEEKNSTHAAAETDALGELDNLERLLESTGVKTPSGGLADDLNLIRKARAAISLLLKDTSVNPVQ